MYLQYFVCNKRNKGQTLNHPPFTIYDDWNHPMNDATEALEKYKLPSSAKSTT